MTTMEISLNMLTITISRVQKHFTRLHSILNEELYIEFEIDFCRMHSLIVLMLSQNMLEKVLLEQTMKMMMPVNFLLKMS